MTDSPENSAAENLRQLYRRICLLRGTERTADAAQLEQVELPAAIAAVHAEGNDDDAISRLFRSEQERIANLRDLAELVAPILAKAVVGALRVTMPATASPSERRRIAPRAPEGANPVPSVADLIDGMLAQEHA